MNSLGEFVESSVKSKSNFHIRELSHRPQVSKDYYLPGTLEDNTEKQSQVYLMANGS